MMEHAVLSRPQEAIEIHLCWGYIQLTKNSKNQPIPRPSRYPVFACLQYAKIIGGRRPGLCDHTNYVNIYVRETQGATGPQLTFLFTSSSSLTSQKFGIPTFGETLQNRPQVIFGGRANLLYQSQHIYHSTIIRCKDNTVYKISLVAALHLQAGAHLATFPSN